MNSVLRQILECRFGTNSLKEVPRDNFLEVAKPNSKFLRSLEIPMNDTNGVTINLSNVSTLLQNIKEQTCGTT